MNSARGVCVAAGIIGATALCLIWAACASDTCEGPESPAPLPPLSKLLDIFVEQKQLDDEAELAMQRLKAKHAIITEVIADRTTLLDAAAQFRDMNARWPMARQRLEERFPGMSYELALCRQVIEDARSELQQRAPDKEESVVSRLEAELAAYGPLQ